MQNRSYITVDIALNKLSILVGSKASGNDCSRSHWLCHN